METFSLCVISDEQRILKNEKQYAEGKQLNKGGRGGGDKRLARVKTRDQCGRRDIETCSLCVTSDDRLESSISRCRRGLFRY